MIKQIVVLCVLIASAGCGGKAAPVAVKGVVNLDGKPMPEGEVRFLVAGEPVVLLPVKAGAFSGSARGGKNRVEVYSYKAAPKSPNALSTDDPNAKVNFIPDRYNGHSRLEAEVKAGGPNDFKFDVTSK